MALLDVLFGLLPRDIKKSDVPLPREPTEALPCTKAKVRVMRDRYRRREALFHPDDAKPTPRQKRVLAGRMENNHPILSGVFGEPVEEGRAAA